MPTWSPQQDAALKAFQRWFSGNPRGEFFRLFGPAGTGKTFIAKGLAEAVGGRVLFGAYTGKAALVLNRKGCPGASTIHSLLYNPKAKSQMRINELRAQIEEEQDPEKLDPLKKELAEENARQSKPSFSLNPDSPIKDCDLLIVDECSMIDRYVGHDLMTFGTPILALGDPFQLPPVKGSGFFPQDNPNVMLTDVHRTALDSPVLRLATQVRNGQELRLGEYGESRVCRRKDLPRGSGLAHDQTLVGTNATRRAANRAMRAQLGFTGDFPQGPRNEGGKGDRLVCRRNNKENGLINGMLFNVIEADDDGESVNMTIEADDGSFVREVSAHREYFLGLDVPHWGRRDKDEFDFGYALTAHNAQGSEWPSVMVADQSEVFRRDRNKWLYTAITRASNRVTVIKNYNDRS
jgi:exodeoxyribonuclease V